MQMEGNFSFVTIRADFNVIKEEVLTKASEKDESSFFKVRLMQAIENLIKDNMNSFITCLKCVCKKQKYTSCLVVYIRLHNQTCVLGSVLS